MKNKLFLTFLVMIFLVFNNLSAEQKKKVDKTAKKSSVKESEKKKKDDKKDEKKKKPVITEHSIKINGKVIKYTATAGYMELKNDKEKSTANVFYIAYVKKDVKDSGKRPLTFSFNGGPGSSSVWLHLGALGPKRVLMKDNGEPTKPPYKLVDNNNSWLDLTDLVFIDPVWTGFSRPAEDQPKKQFHGLKEDISSVGDFIRLYTTQNKRWLSPKFIAGESYGTTRAAGLAEYLQRRFGMELNGLFLISAVLDFKTISLSANNDLPYVLFFPTFAATARYHGKLGSGFSDFEKFLDEVRLWSEKEYFMALSKGSMLSSVERKEIIGKLSKYSSLSKEYLDNTDLRISIFRFAKELLRDSKRTVGRFDSRIKGLDRESAGSYCDYDPSYAAVQGTFTACLNHYLRSELKFETDIPYEILSRKVHPWNWGSASQGYVNVAEPLRKAVSRNKYLKVFIGCGYYDMATPFFAIEHTIEHLGLEKSLMKNFVFKYYEAGHMMYTHKPSLFKLKKDVSEFMKDVLGK